MYVNFLPYDEEMKKQIRESTFISIERERGKIAEFPVKEGRLFNFVTEERKVDCFKGGIDVKRFLFCNSNEAKIGRQKINQESKRREREERER